MIRQTTAVRLAVALALLLGSCADSPVDGGGTPTTSIDAVDTSATPPTSTSAEQPGATSDLRQAVDEWLAATDTVGVVALVVSADGSSEAVSSGWADRESETPLTSEASFRVGSITKVYTAALVLALVEDGLLTLEQSAASYIESLPGEITVSQLLDHTSGLRDVDIAAGIFEALQTGNELGEPRDAVLESLADGLAFSPGTRQSYSSIGYLAIGRLIESVTGLTYGDALREHILEPLGLGRSEMETSEATLPTAYERIGPGSPAISLAAIPTSGFAKGAGAAGALVAPAAEVAEFIRALFDGRVIAAESFALMLDASPPRRDYGLGMSIYATPAGDVYGHNGRTIGFASSVRHDPASGITVVVLSNDGGAPTDDLASQLILASMRAG